MESVAKLREWGSSIGLVIPKEIVRQESLKSGDEVVVEIKKAKTLKDLFGSLKNLKIEKMWVILFSDVLINNFYRREEKGNDRRKSYSSWREGDYVF